MVLTMSAGVALIRHRTDEGRQAAKRRGVSFGRPQKLRPDQKALAVSLVREDRSISEVAKEPSILEMAVVGTPAYLEARGVPQSPQDLVGHNCINLRLVSAGALYAWEFE